MTCRARIDDPCPPRNARPRAIARRSSGDPCRACSEAAVALCGSFPAGGAAWAGGIGAGRRRTAHCGTGFGSFGLKGLAARVYFAFTLSVPPRPRRPGPCRDGAHHQGQERGRRATRRTAGTGWAVCAPVNRAHPAPDPHNTLRAIALYRAHRALTGTGGMRYQTDGCGPVAQRSEQGAHNALVGGSSPSGPTIAKPGERIED